MGGFAAGLLDVVHAASDGTALGAVEQGSLLGDLALFVSLKGGEVESPPPEWLAGFSDFVKAFPFGFPEPYAFLRAQVGAHDFQQGVTAAADFWCQPLADDPAECVGQAHAKLLLFLGFEHAQNAVDGLAGIDGVQGAEHEVASLRSTQSDLDRLPVAHFPDQNDLGGLAQGRAEPVGEAVEIGAQFALVEGSRVMRVNKLDGVLQRDNVDGACAADLVEDRGQSSGFAGAGGAGDEHQASLLPRNVGDNLREV